MYIRRQKFAGLGRESAFLWGARQTGKSTLLKKLNPRPLILIYYYRMNLTGL
jgi:predicted AAA+ superfamily ATPase